MMAAERPAAPLVAAPFLAAAERSLLDRFEAALCACLDNDDLDAAEWPSFFSVRVVVVLRLAVDSLLALAWLLFLPPVLLPALTSCSAFLRVAADALPSPGGLTATPERRALDSPIAMACLVFFAPCLPSRM